jgi:hypothetical protein
MHPEQSCFFGFDAADGGEISMVMLRRDPGGGWQVQQVEGPHCEDMSRLVARICGTPRPRPGEATDAHPPTGDALHEMAAQWMAGHGDIIAQLTDEQRATIQVTLGRLITEGKLRL